MRTLASNLWTGREDGRMGAMLLAGLAVWSLYSAAVIAVGGVVLDETVVPAQIITGTVQYPAGHPHAIFYPKAFNLVNYAAAALWSLRPDPLFLSAVRNLQFLILSLIVPFAFGLILTGKPAWGHLAAALTATEAGLRYQGTYPMWVFPNFYSHGHVGLHLALLAVALMLARMWRSAGFLAGLLPALHAAMPLVVWPWTACFVWFSGRGPERNDRRRVYAAFALGLAICAGFGFWLQQQTARASEATPYDVRLAGDVIYREFSERIDVHRGATPVFSQGYITNALALFLLGGLAFGGIRRQAPGNSLYWALLFLAGVWAYVFGAALFRQVFWWFPSVLHILMPNRFSNLSAVLLIPVAVTVIARALDRARPTRTAGYAVLIAALAGCAAVVFADPGRARLHLLAAMWALALALDFAHASGPARRAASAAAAAILGCSLWFFSIGQVGIYFAAGYLLAGGTLLAFWRRFSMAGPALPAWARAGVLGSSILIAAVAFQNAAKRAGQTDSRWDAISSDDSQVAHWLAENARPQEPVLPVMFPRAELQPKTGHPVLAELETLYLMSYLPELAPPIGTLVKDLYGIDLSSPTRMKEIAPGGHLSFYSPVWREGWEKRSLREWQSLGLRYDFRLVLAESGMKIDLPAVLKTRTWTLHTIPR